MHPYFLGLLAEVLSADGQVDEGLEILARALKLVETTGERYYEAELHRLRGELLLSAAGPDDRTAEARSSLQTALDVAHRQNSLSLELRAAVSAAQLMRRRDARDGKLADARSILQPICDLFVEGFGTSDWRAATALCAGAD